MKNTALNILDLDSINLSTLLGLTANSLLDRAPKCDDDESDAVAEPKGRRLASAETRMENLEKLLDRKLVEFDEDFKRRETDILALQDAITELNHDVHNLRLINAIKNGKVHVIDADTGEIIPFKFES